MKKMIATMLIAFSLLGTGNLRAADFNYGGTYTGSVAGSMMTAMWDFMEWFLGKRNNNWRHPYYQGWGSAWNIPYNNPYSLYANALGLRSVSNNPYRYRDYWDDPNNPWVDMQPMDGTWLAQSGEYWYVRGNRFVLVSGGEQRATGDFIVEGNFILTRLPWGEVEFEFRQMDDVLILRDVSGRLMLLRRIEAGDWSW